MTIAPTQPTTISQDDYLVFWLCAGVDLVMMSQSFTNKELELLVAIFKSSGGIKPSWTKIQEQGFMPDGMTYNAAAQT